MIVFLKCIILRNLSHCFPLPATAEVMLSRDGMVTDIQPPSCEVLISFHSSIPYPQAMEDQSNNSP